MISSHSSSSFRCQFIELAGGDALVDPGADLLSDEDGVAVIDAEAVAELLEASGNLVEVHGFLTPISLHHIHLACTFLRHSLGRSGLTLIIKGEGGQGGGG